MRKFLLGGLLLAVVFGLCATRAGRPPLATSGPRLDASLVKQWDSAGSPARQAAFSRDGKMLATSNAAGDVTVMQTTDWHDLRKFKVPGGATSLIFSADGTQLLTAGYDGIVRAWRISDGRLASQYRGAQDTIWALSLRPDGRELAAAGEDGVIHLWSLETGAVRTLKGHQRTAWAIDYAPDGRALVSGGFDKTVRIWRAGTPPKTISGHTEAVVGLDISPDGRLLASGGDDSTLRFWNGNDGKALRVIDAGNHLWDVEFSRDGKWLATSGRARGGPGTFWYQLTSIGGGATPVHIWRVSDGAAVAALPHPDDVMYATFSPDQRFLVTSGEDAVRLWRLEQR
jgi:WD40 repeat protein